MNNYRKVQAIINNEFPELIELKFGQPITLQNLLRHLAQCLRPLLEIDFNDRDTIKIRQGFGDEKEPDNWIFLDLSKPPQEWGEEKWGEILRIIE